MPLVIQGAFRLKITILMPSLDLLSVYRHLIGNTGIFLLFRGTALYCLRWGRTETEFSLGGTNDQGNCI